MALDVKINICTVLSGDVGEEEERRTRVGGSRRIARSIQQETKEIETRNKTRSMILNKKETCDNTIICRPWALAGAAGMQQSILCTEEGSA